KSINSDVRNLQRKGYDWVGWKRDSKSGQTKLGQVKLGQTSSSSLLSSLSSSSLSLAQKDFVELRFGFANVRNFTSVTFHCLHAPGKGVKITKNLPKRSTTQIRYWIIVVAAASAALLVVVIVVVVVVAVVSNKR
ncbi:hypothetical protein HELRODRAFT_195151, partial [Helobdella robusta]|uniref:Uncharacterized protein n=1 Tax=Helobdella robusta TaxID=6412 RepID=T1FWT4_HELRO